MVRTSSMIIIVLPFRVGQETLIKALLLFPGVSHTNFGNSDYRGFWSGAQGGRKGFVDLSGGD